MITVREWFETIAWALQDDDGENSFERYPLSRMIEAYNDAMCLVAQHRKDLFTEVRIVELQTGKYQDVRGCCTDVLDVMDQTDAQGNLIKSLTGARERTTVAKRHWKKPSCLSKGTGYLIDNISIDSNLQGRFTVDPPVPCGERAYVAVKCVAVPCPLTEADSGNAFDNNCELSVAAKHYVLAWMMSGDRFDNALGQDKQYHYRMFFDILGISYQQDERIKSPEKA